MNSADVTQPKLTPARMAFNLIFNIFVVLAIPAMLVSAYKFSQKMNDDAYIVEAKLFVRADFARSMRRFAEYSGCNGLPMNHRDFSRNGVPSETVWGEPWTMSASEDRVVLSYPLKGARDVEVMGQRLIDELTPTEYEKLQEYSIQEVRLEGESLTVEYSCGRPPRSAK